MKDVPRWGVERANLGVCKSAISVRQLEASRPRTSTYEAQCFNIIDIQLSDMNNDGKNPYIS